MDLSSCEQTGNHCRVALCLHDNLGAIDDLCIVAKVAPLVQKEDNSYKRSFRDTKYQ